MSSLIPNKTAEESTNSLVSFLPSGPVFLGASIDDTNLRKLIWGLAIELAREEGVLGSIADGHDIRYANADFLDLWESALQIPDGAFPESSDLETRRRYVLAKLAHCNVTTRADFINLANFLGFQIDIRTGSEVGIFPLPFPLVFYDRPQTARFDHVITIYVENFPYVFPLQFPVNFANSIKGIIEVLFARLKPANTNLMFFYSLYDNGALITEDFANFLVQEDGTSLLLW